MRGAVCATSLSVILSYKRSVPCGELRPSRPLGFETAIRRDATQSIEELPPRGPAPLEPLLKSAFGGDNPHLSPRLYDDLFFFFFFLPYGLLAFPVGRRLFHFVCILPGGGSSYSNQVIAKSFLPFRSVISLFILSFICRLRACPHAGHRVAITIGRPGAIPAECRPPPPLFFS